MFKKLNGIIGSFFKIGFNGHAIQEHTDGLAIRNNAVDADANLVVARPQGTNKDTHAATFADVKERATLVEFGFDGGSPPAAGTNTGKYGFCHTSGGTWNAGELAYDDGVTLAAVIPYKMMVLMTKVSVAGTVNLIDEGIYIAESAAAPYSWILKGDGTPNYTGVERVIAIPVTSTAGNFDATTAVPENGVITRVSVKVTTPYDNDSTITVLIHGSVGDLTVQATTENNAEVADTYETGNYEVVTADQAGPPRVTLAVGGSGAATVYVHWALPYV
jgi:hypothetical protein